LPPRRSGARRVAWHKTVSESSDSRENRVQTHSDRFPIRCVNH
jgi:hypothetical protein